MSRIVRSPGPARAGVLLLTAFWLVPIELPWSNIWPSPLRSAAAQYPPQVPDGQDLPFIPDFGQPPDDSNTPRPSRSSRAKAARKKARAAEKGPTRKADANAKDVNPKTNEAATAPKAKTTNSGRSPLARTPPAERDKVVEAEGLKRWRQANPKLKPEVVSGEHFLLFSNLPKDRAISTLKALERPYAHLRALLGAPPGGGVEKVSLYVFNSPNDFVEFVRSVEGRDADTDLRATAKLGIPQPYVAAVDPAGGKREEPAGRRRAGRAKKRAEEKAGTGAERTLLGVLTEGLGSGAVAAAGPAPRWLREGVGTYLASKVEPHSPHYRQLRQTALANYQQGWPTKANETLGSSEQIGADDLHAVSFALVEAMMAANPQAFPTFLRGMLQTEAKLDDLLEKIYGGNREAFLKDTGDWVAVTYGGAQ